MCGIFGFNWYDRQLLKDMSEVLAHRGPNNSGFYSDDGISIGHRRLSIIDLSEKGNQPMSDEDSDVVLSYNGEIYNFKELRHQLKGKGHRFVSETDTEVIIAAYKEYGVKCLEKFNGFFAFVLFDRRKNQLFLARDRIGIKPLYYYLNGKQFVFASEMKAILCHDMQKNVNKLVVNKFLAYRYISGPQTILDNVYRMPPGHYGIFDLKEYSFVVKPFWQLSSAQQSISKQSAQQKLLDMFKDSVEKRLMSDVPLGAYLSGGIDSTSVVAMMKQLGVKDIKTFSMSFEHDIVGNESAYAREIASHFDCDHHSYVIGPDIVKDLPKIVYHLDEPLADPATVPVYYLSQEAKKKVTVVLTGDGADELFAGYDQYKFLMMGHRMRSLPRFVRSSMIPFMIRKMPISLLNKIYHYSEATGKKLFERFGNFISCIREDPGKAYLEVVSVFNETEKKDILLPAFADAKPIHDELRHHFSSQHDFLTQLLRLDLGTYLPEDLLMKPDKMCMAHGIEARVPFLDHRLVEFAFSLPSSYKLRGTTGKYLMKQSFKQLVPQSTLQRKKQPFQVPLDHWLQHDLKSYFHDLLMGETARQYFSTKEMEKIFERYDSSRLFYGRQLWSLGNFVLWHKQFVDGEKLF